MKLIKKGYAKLSGDISFRFLALGRNVVGPGGKLSGLPPAPLGRGLSMGPVLFRQSSYRGKVTAASRDPGCDL